MGAVQCYAGGAATWKKQRGVSWGAGTAGWGGWAGEMTWCLGSQPGPCRETIGQGGIYCAPSTVLLPQPTHTLPYSPTLHSIIPPSIPFPLSCLTPLHTHPTPPPHALLYPLWDLGSHVPHSRVRSLYLGLLTVGGISGSSAPAME